MRAATRASMIDAIRTFLSVWNAPTTTTVADWENVNRLMQQAWEQHEHDVEGADWQGYDGPMYNPLWDSARLQYQTGRIWHALSDGLYHTVQEIAALTGDPENSVSAQVRHLRKPRFGSWIIDCDRVDGGNLFSYRMRNYDGTCGPPWYATPPTNHEG